MALEPNASFNPCSLPNKDEQTPAKIWELLRRNTAFRKVVQKLIRLDSEERENHEKGSPYHGSAWNASLQLVEKAGERHPFAGLALQWLVPEPHFHAWRWASKRGASGARVAEVGEGRTPDITDSENWRWLVADGMNGHQGGWILRGPEIHFQPWGVKRPAKSQTFGDDWRNWKPGEKLFSCETPWPRTPGGFRQQFMSSWRTLYDFCAANPGFPAPYETTFFEGWSLSDALCTSFPKCYDDNLTKICEFKALSDGFRVFAVPRQLLTRRAAKAAFDRIYKELAKSLPEERSFFGTPGQWGDFLAVEHLQSNGLTATKNAIQAHLRQIHSRKANPFRDTRQTYETDVTNRVLHLEKLRKRIYPGWTLSKLLKPMPHRRAKHGAKK